MESICEHPVGGFLEGIRNYLGHGLGRWRTRVQTGSGQRPMPNRGNRETLPEQLRLRVGESPYKDKMQEILHDGSFCS